MIFFGGDDGIPVDGVPDISDDDGCDCCKCSICNPENSIDVSRKYDDMSKVMSGENMIDISKLLDNEYSNINNVLTDIRNPYMDTDDKSSNSILMDILNGNRLYYEFKIDDEYIDNINNLMVFANGVKVSDYIRILNMILIPERYATEKEDMDVVVTQYNYDILEEAPIIRVVSELDFESDDEYRKSFYKKDDSDNKMYKLYYTMKLSSTYNRNQLLLFVDGKVTDNFKLEYDKLTIYSYNTYHTVELFILKNNYNIVNFEDQCYKDKYFVINNFRENPYPYNISD